MTALAHVRVQSVSVEYPTEGGPVRALDGVSLDVAPGDSLAITGPSGCGKSTLLGLLGGLDVPTAGCVWIGDQEISRLSEPRRARLRRHDLGLIFQSDNLLPFLTAVENVGLQLSVGGGVDDARPCLEMLDVLGVSAVADKLPDQLSGGQRQRVAIARALIRRPRVILADEPTGALDQSNAATVIDLLLHARSETGATLIVVTHDCGVAGRMDRVLGLRDGRLAEDANAPTGSHPRVAEQAPW